MRIMSLGVLKNEDIHGHMINCDSKWERLRVGSTKSGDQGHRQFLVVEWTLRT